MFTIALFTIAKTRQQTKCSIDRGTDKEHTRNGKSFWKVLLRISIRPNPPQHPLLPPQPLKRSPGDTAKDALFTSQEKFFQELFIHELLAEEDPHLAEQFPKLSEAAAGMDSDAMSQQNFTSRLKDTLSGLAKDATDLENSSLSEEKLTMAMEQLGMDEGDGYAPSCIPMQSIRQNLPSKDALYPSPNEVTREVSGLQFEKYLEEHSVMGKICEQFDAQTPTDRPLRRLILSGAGSLQQPQDVGHPSKELAREMPPSLNFDLDAFNLSGSPGASGVWCLIL
uniref:Peroxisomal biogenesis factor 19 n=1 Tax=Sus scrofa TaxID=9823 RepID=A0A8D0I6H5_PIG